VFEEVVFWSMQRAYQLRDTTAHCSLRVAGSPERRCLRDGIVCSRRLRRKEGVKAIRRAHPGDCLPQRWRRASLFVVVFGGEG
jgi:hypothetical protein